MHLFISCLAGSIWYVHRNQEERDCIISFTSLAKLFKVKSCLRKIIKDAFPLRIWLTGFKYYNTCESVS